VYVYVCVYVLYVCAYSTEDGPPHALPTTRAAPCSSSHSRQLEVLIGDTFNDPTHVVSFLRGTISQLGASAVTATGSAGSTTVPVDAAAEATDAAAANASSDGAAADAEEEAAGSACMWLALEAERPLHIPRRECAHARNPPLTRGCLLSRSAHPSVSRGGRMAEQLLERSCVVMGRWEGLFEYVVYKCEHAAADRQHTAPAASTPPLAASTAPLAVTSSGGACAAEHARVLHCAVSPCRMHAAVGASWGGWASRCGRGALMLGAHQLLPFFHDLLHPERFERLMVLGIN
jgi:hypothetical protein